jgi:hypothetical protein
MERMPKKGLCRTSSATRRRFLQRTIGAGACVSLGSMVGSCADVGTKPPADPFDPNSDRVIDVVGAGMPYRQDDPAWANDVMWDRDLVIRADTELNGHSRADAKALLRKFDDGNTIGNEGCLLTSLAMILRLLAPERQPPWTPKTLNTTAQALYYYTRAGLAMTALYADLVSEVTSGEVQLCAKEEYLAGVRSWPRIYVNTSTLVRAYRGLPPAKRSNFLLMLKTGTYDDTIASHYVLLHPNASESPDNANPEILDPAKPLEETRPWCLSDSAKRITGDPEIANEWAESGIEQTQIGGVWVFTRWRSSHDRSLVEPLIRSWAAELTAAKT